MLKYGSRCLLLEKVVGRKILYQLKPNVAVSIKDVYPCHWNLFYMKNYIHTLKIEDLVVEKL